MAITSNYALRLPASLKKAVEEVAREDGTTLNQFIVSAVAEKLSALKTADYFAEHAARGARRHRRGASHFEAAWRRAPAIGRRGSERISERGVANRILRSWPRSHRWIAG
jgi:hypothetical protein